MAVVRARAWSRPVAGSNGNPFYSEIFRQQGGGRDRKAEYDRMNGEVKALIRAYRAEGSGPLKELILEQIVKASKPLTSGWVNRLVRAEWLMEHEDVEAAAVTGLLEAIKRFDLGRGTKFSTYGSWWIIKEIMECLRVEGMMITLPKSMFEKLGKFSRMRHKLQEHGGEPSDAEVAGELGVPFQKLEQGLHATRFAFSLDATFDSEDRPESETTGKEMIPDEKWNGSHELTVSVRKALARLDPQRREIWQKMFFDGMRFKEVAEIFTERYGIGARKVSSLKAGGKEILRRELERQGVDGKTPGELELLSH